MFSRELKSESNANQITLISEKWHDKHGRQPNDQWGLDIAHIITNNQINSIKGLQLAQGNNLLPDNIAFKYYSLRYINYSIYLMLYLSPTICVNKAEFFFQLKLYV